MGFFDRLIPKKNRPPPRSPLRPPLLVETTPPPAQPTVPELPPQVIDAIDKPRSKRAIETIGEGRPPIVDVVGDEGVVRVNVVRREGARILWFNWALAEELGLEIPPDRKMTPELEKKLLDALSWEVLPKGQDPGGRATKEAFSEFYAGPGLGYNKGAGRAAFFGDLNINAKGIGAIEEMLNEMTSYDHRHGGMSLVEGGLESVLGEVNTNLFSRGSTRILAILDRGDYITWEGGGGERKGVAFRLGQQTRPAHLLVGPGTTKYDRLLRMMNGSGDLLEGKDGKLDLTASLMRLVTAHARTAAEQYRHRILHGALSPSNQGHDAAMVDLGSETSQPRQAPIRVLERDAQNPIYSFESEHVRRLVNLESYYSIVEAALGQRPAVRAKTSFRPFSVQKAFKDAYAVELTRALTSATGLPPGIADAVLTQHAGLAKGFADAARTLAAETNPGFELNVDKRTVEDCSVVDLYGAFARIPRQYFLDPGGDLVTKMRDALELRGTRSEEDQARIDGKIQELASLYGSLLTAAREIHTAQGGDPIAFEHSVIQRAEFENAPTTYLYRANLRWTMIETIAEYEKTLDTDAFQRKIDSIVAHSLRNVDALKKTGESHTLDDGTRIIQERTIRGVTYAVRIPSETGEKKDPAVDVAVPVERLDDGRFRLPSLDGAILDADQLHALAFRYTVDDWKTHGEENARLENDRLVFSIPSFASQTARMEGLFHVKKGNFWIKDRASNFEGYIFAVPDAWEK